MKTLCKTKEDARSIAIQWQNWQARQSLSYTQILKYQNYFLTLARKFNLIREFKENGII